MAHERRNIRDQIVTQLKGPSNDRTAAGAKVVKSRRAPTKQSQVPLISVFNGAEPIKEGGDKSSELERLYEVTIVGWVIAESDTEVDDALDALVLQIEAAMDLDRTLDRHASNSSLINTDFVVDLEAERPIGAAILTYACPYFTGTRNAAPTADFALAGVQTSIAGDQATADQAGDLVTIPIV